MNHVEIDTLHTPFAQFLTTAGIPFIRARSDRESTIALGHPDFTLLAHNACLMIEFKTKEGKLSADQEKRIAVLRSAGNKVSVLRDLDDAMHLTVAWRNSLSELATFVETTATDQPARSLFRFGQAIMERNRDGSLTRIRNAGPGDLLIPELAA